jgi:gluconolactonase
MATRVVLSWMVLGWLVLACAPWCRAAEHADLPPSESVEPQLYATGFEFAEGPALDAKGNLFVANYRATGTVGRIAPDGTAEVFCDLPNAVPMEGFDVRADGLKVDSQRRLIAADSGAGRLLRIAEDGSRVEVLADRCEGKRFNAIAEVALDTAGNVYFTDPGDPGADAPVGSVYRFGITTGKVTRLDTGLAAPTGVGISPNQQHLCVAESGKYRVLIYDLTEDGRVADRRVLIDFPRTTEGKILGGDFPPNGMVFDSAGRLYVAMWTGQLINVVEVPAGTLVRQYKAGGTQVTNCHFHDGYLYTTVAAKEAVFRLKLGVKGFKYSERAGH